MNVFKDDLFRNKYFVTILAILALVVGIAWFIGYNSVESKCRRYAQRLGSTFGAGSGSKLRDLQIQTASDPLIQDCVKRGGPK